MLLFRRTQVPVSGLTGSSQAPENALPGYWPSSSLCGPCMHVVHRHTYMQVNTYTHNKNKCKKKIKNQLCIVFLLLTTKGKKKQTNSFFWDLKTQLFYSGINMFVNWEMLWLFFLEHIPWIRFKQTTLISFCACFGLVQVSWFLPSPTEHLSYSIQAAVR